MNSFEKEIKDCMSQRVANIANNFSKGENDFLTQEDFEGLKKTNEVYTPDDILNYRADLQKAFDDEEIDEKDYVKGIEEIAKLKIVKVENGLNMPKTFFFKSLVEDLEKAEPEDDDDDDDDFDDMEKAIGSKKGEGSRGGKVIGHTKSGKPIYDTAEHAAHYTFNEQDHSDAEQLHSKRAQEASKKGDFETFDKELTEGGKHALNRLNSKKSKKKDKEDNEESPFDNEKKKEKSQSKSKGEKLIEEIFFENESGASQGSLKKLVKKYGKKVNSLIEKAKEEKVPELDEKLKEIAGGEESDDEDPKWMKHAKKYPVLKEISDLFNDVFEDM